MRENGEKLAAVLERVSEAVASAGRAVRGAFEGIDWEAVQARLDALQEEAVRLGREGWTLPMWATPAEVADILEGAQRRPIDDVFEDYFEVDGGTFYERMKESVLTKPSLVKGRPLIEQCFWAYEQEHYLIVVPAMIAVVEGAVIDAGGPRAVKQKDPKQTAKRISANVRKDALGRAVWASVDAFISELFATASFAGPQPVQLNRAWILHGRAEPEWKKADCLRLFQAADTIAR